MELAGGPRLDEEGGARLAGAEAQTTTWWTPFCSRPAAPDPLTTHNNIMQKWSNHSATDRRMDGNTR